ncbi:MAG: metallophosphoesterase N-terminal domain-containing protein, partial [Proteiniphilum sp.]
MRKKTFHSLLLAALLCVWLPVRTAAQTPGPIKGRVTCGEKGVANVVVTDGQTCVLTDKEGLFSIPAPDGNATFVYISTPAGYLPH